MQYVVTGMPIDLLLSGARSAMQTLNLTVVASLLCWYLQCWYPSDAILTSDAQCWFHAPAIDDLLVSTAYPIAVVVCLWLVQMIYVWIREKSRVTKKDKSPTDSSGVKSNYFMAFLVFTFLILPSTTVTIVEVFSCKDVDPDDAADGDDRYMMVDYSVSCSSSKYHFGRVWAIVSIGRLWRLLGG